MSNAWRRGFSVIQSLTDRLTAQVLRNVERERRKELEAEGLSREEAGALVRKERKASKLMHTAKAVPNRVQLRAAGMNIARTTGKSHARLSRARKTPASLYTLIAVRLPPGQDGTSKTIVVPRDKFERR